MFEELKKKLKNKYYLFLAKKYVKDIKRKDNSQGLSLDVMSEPVKYKILEEGLTDDKNLIYALIINLRSKESRKEMIAKHITTEDFPDINIIKDLPAPLKIEILENKITGYMPYNIKDIFNSLSDSEFISLIENNKNIIDEYLENKDFLSKLNTVFIKPEDFLETILYSRFLKIEDIKLKQLFQKVISVKTLTDNVDDKILKVVGSKHDIDEYIATNVDKISSEEKKLEFLLKNPYDIKSFDLIYKTLSEENKRKILSIIFTEEKIKNYVSEKKRENQLVSFQNI